MCGVWISASPNGIRIARYYSAKRGLAERARGETGGMLDFLGFAERGFPILARQIANQPAQGVATGISTGSLAQNGPILDPTFGETHVRHHA